MVTRTIAIVFAAWIAGEQARPAIDLKTTLERAADRVQFYFARAQSLVCLETVALQPLTMGLTAAGFSRVVQSELRLAWDPNKATETPLEATTHRQVVKVNGRPPRKDDDNNCTSPEQNETETQPLSMLLPDQRLAFDFTVHGTDKHEGRAAIVLNYRDRAKPKVAVTLLKDHEDCVSYSIDGGMRGRIWIDAETYDVLRLDTGLIGLVDIPLPWKAARRVPYNAVWTMERMDTSIRFKPVRFSDPEETLILPVSSSSLRVTRSSGSPRLRTTTEYTQYRRFLTGARVVPPK